MAVTAYQRDVTVDGKYLCNFIADTAGELPTVGIANGSIGYVVATDAHYGLHSGAWVLFSTAAAGPVSVLKRDAAPVTIASLTETVIFTHTIPANTVGANDELRLRLKNQFRNNSGAARGFIIRVKLGGSTIINVTTGTAAYPAGATIRHVDLTVLLSALGATNSQLCTLTATVTAPSSTFGTLTTGVGHTWASALNYLEVGSGTLSQDMTASKVFEVTIELSATNANLTWYNYSGTLEKLAA